MTTNIIHNEDCQSGIKNIPDASVDIILTDPPYLYLKGQKLERPFGEELFFSECKRILKKDGFIILFGRGTSFYRWNTRLADLGFNFKEEIVWNKSHSTSSMTAISRTHETCSIYSIDGVINTSWVPYVEMKEFDAEAMAQDIKRIKSALNNTKSLDALMQYVEKGLVNYGDDKKRGYNTTIQGVTKEQDRAVKTMQAICRGMKEKSIIKVQREHYAFNHPTQKPVRLIERLIALVKKGDRPMIADFFSGSGAISEAAMNMDCDSIAYEIDKDWFDESVERINKRREELSKVNPVQELFNQAV